MSTKEVAQDVEAWAAEVGVSQGLSAYPQEPANYSDAFPLAAAAIQRDVERGAAPDFSDQGYQQVRVQVIVVDVHLLVSPDDPWTSDQQLYDIVDLLKASLKRDQTLGQRVEQASRDYEVTYDGEVQTADGTVARMATFRITLGQRVEA